MNCKKIIAIALAASMIFSIGASAKTLEFTIGDKNLYINEGAIRKTELDAPIYIKDGRTMVPVRAISEAFDAEVLWDDAERKVTINAGNDKIELIISSNEAMVNGEIKQLDVAPEITDGRTMVPIRFVSEMLSKNVEYIGASSQILISDSLPAITVDGYPITIDDLRFMYLYYYLIQNAYEPEEILPVIINDLVASASITNDAEKSGYSLPLEYQKEIADNLLKDKELFYPLSLVAPGVKLITNISTTTEYCYKKLSDGAAPEELLKEYNETSVCAKHILIPTVDLETGEELNEKQALSAKATANAIYQKAKNGDDFDELIALHSSDEGSKYYPEGYVFTYGEMVPEFEKTAFELKENEISKPVKTSYGYHIIKRLPLPEMNYMYEETISTKIAQKNLEKYTDSVINSANVVYNMSEEEIIKNLGITSSDIEAYIAQMISVQ